MSSPFTVTEIPTDECWQLLDATRFGRLAMAVGSDPDIYPINFLVDGETILMKTTAGNKLFEVTLNPSVALEADYVSDTEAWSVIVKGIARVVDSFSEMYEKDEKHLETWLPSPKSIYVTIERTTVSGRRFTRDPDASADA